MYVIELMTNIPFSSSAECHSSFAFKFLPSCLCPHQLLSISCINF